MNPADRIVRPPTPGIAPATPETSNPRPTMSIVLSRRAALLAWLACFSSVGAQQVFDAAAKRGVPFRSSGSRNAVLADVDRDGDVDVLVATGSIDRLFLNDGSGLFDDATATHMPQVDGITSRLTVVDIDGDGDLDVLSARSNLLGSGLDGLYLNDGTGRFTDVSATRLPQLDFDSSQILVGDVDGDRDLDLVVVGGIVGPVQNRLYLNDGTGVFGDATTQLPTSTDPTSSAAFLDAEGDGDLDLYFGNGDFQTRADQLLLNDGAGNFTVAPTPLPGPHARTQVVLADDFDGDGDTDVFLGTRFSSDPSRLLLNDGSGSFTVAPATQFPPAPIGVDEASLVDFDGDGDRDVLCGDEDATSPALYRNDGSGTFVVVRPLAGDEFGRARHYLVADFDADGDRDLFVARAGGLSDRLLLADGGGGYVDATETLAFPRLDGTVFRLDAADFDLDGDVDLAVLNGTLTILANEGFGDLSDVSTLVLPPGNFDEIGDVAAGDFDGDGDPDLALVRARSRQNLLLLNDGTGRFVDASSRLPQVLDDSRSIAAGDVDGDGDLDLVIGNGDLGTGYLSAKDCLLLNDGTGRFARAGLTAYPTIDRTTNRVELADLDGDGDLDVILGDLFGMQIYLDVGGGNFRVATDTAIPTILNQPVRDFALGDIEGDGDLDLWVGGNNGQDIYLNDGSGRFTAMPGALPGGATAVYSGGFVDLDSDGDLDLVSWGSSGTTTYRHQAAGRFTVVPDALGDGPTGTSSLFWANDLDLDGDQDLLLSGFLDSVHFRVNLVRQLAAPQLARVGRSYEITYRGRASTSARQVPVLLSPRPARIDLGSLGVLGVDPATSITLPAVQLAPGATAGSLQLALPNQAALVGLEFFLQGFDPFPGDLHLTNRVRDVFVPR